MIQLAQRPIHNPILGEDPNSINDPTGFLGAFIPKLLTIGFIVAVITFVFILLWGGIAWMTSGGDKQKVEEARGRISNAIVGLFIVFFVFVIIKLVEMLFGIKIMELDFGILKL